MSRVTPSKCQLPGLAAAGPISSSCVWLPTRGEAIAKCETQSRLCPGTQGVKLGSSEWKRPEGTRRGLPLTRLPWTPPSMAAHQCGPTTCREPGDDKHQEIKGACGKTARGEGSVRSNGRWGARREPADGHIVAADPPGTLIPTRQLPVLRLYPPWRRERGKGRRPLERAAPASQRAFKGRRARQLRVNAAGKASDEV